MTVLFPNVPDTDGVPPVQRDATNAAPTPAPQMKKDGVTVTANPVNKWGIYTQEGAIALECDSVAMVNFEADSRIADFPIEKGGFESYDKVMLPFSNAVRLTKGGTLAERTAFMNDVKAMRSDLILYNVVTPESTFRNVNFGSVSIARSIESGAGMIILDVQLREIRQSATVTFSATKEPASASPSNNGPSQTTAAPTTAGGIQ